MSFREYVQGVRELWANNGKLLILSMVTTLVLTVAFVATVITLAVAEDTFEPLGDYNDPQIVLSEGPYRAGGTITTSTVKCNVSDKDVTVFGSSFWRKIDEPQQVIPHRQGVSIFPANTCLERTFTNFVPSDVVPGEWQLEGIDIVTEGSKTQQKGWRNESIEVAE